MLKSTKNKKKNADKYDLKCSYPLLSAIEAVQNITYTKFDSSIDVAIKLGVNPKKSDQQVRGSAMLPHGNGKRCKILILCSESKASKVKGMQVDHIGLDDYITKIEKGWTDIDVIIAEPSVMPKVGKIGKILGPRGLMPNPMNNTVTENIAEAVRDFKSGKIDFKIDRGSVVHASIGRVSFMPEQIKVNFNALLQSLTKLKPASSKGTYIKSIYLSSTMSSGILVDKPDTV